MLCDTVVAALMALKRKKRLEKQLQQIDGTLSTIEFQREALENANTNTEVLHNMSYAAKALKAAHQQLWVHFITFNPNNDINTLFLVVYRFKVKYKKESFMSHSFWLPHGVCNLNVFIMVKQDALMCWCLLFMFI